MTTFCQPGSDTTVLLLSGRISLEGADPDRSAAPCQSLVDLGYRPSRGRQPQLSGSASVLDKVLAGRLHPP